MKMTLEERLNVFKTAGYSYNPSTGYILSPFNKEIKGLSNDYIIVRYHKKIFVYGHQLAWFLYYNEIPTEVDHINRKKSDNRIINLRILKHNENGWNNDALGYTKNKRDNNFTAQIVVNYKRKFLGNFPTEEEARNAYLEAKKIYHKINVD